MCLIFLCFFDHINSLRKTVNLIFNCTDPHLHKRFRCQTNKPEQIHILQMFYILFRNPMKLFCIVIFFLYLYVFIFYS